MSLYPSLDTAESNEIRQLQSSVATVQNQDQLVLKQGSLYPSVECMGLKVVEKQKSSNNQVALKQEQLLKALGSPLKAQVDHTLRQITLCKDASGKVGLLVAEINQGIFVSFVQKDSPAAMGGLKFGDQILQLNGTVLAGYSADKVHSMFKKCSVNNIQLIVRDRPFERTVTLVKDGAGQIGFEFKKGKISKLVKDSSAARNGLVIDHQLLEVQGQNVIGMNDKEIVHIIENAGPMVTLCIVPSFVFEQMIKQIRPSLIKESMDHSVVM